MSKEKKNVNKEAMQELSENEIEYKKKMSRQTVMTIAMICVSVFVISVATYAWYLISNAPKITGMEFKADTIGDLWIADAVKDENTGVATNTKPTSDKFYTFISLGQDDSTLNKGLSPVTTDNGVDFYRPIYTNNVVTSVKKMETSGANDESTLLHTKYVYEKTFWLRAGNETDTAETEKYYNVFLVGKTDADIPEGEAFSGCFLRTKGSDSANTTNGAENALRISFEFDGSSVYDVKYGDAEKKYYYAVNKDDSTKNLVRIYEPNADTHISTGNTNESNAKKATNRAAQTSATHVGKLYDYNKVPYATIKQKFDKSFLVTTKSEDVYSYSVDDIKNYTPFTEPNSYDKVGKDNKSAILCTIKENQPVKVTMRVWIEGSDADCVNGISAKSIAGQIQFIAEENFAKYGTINENENDKVYTAADSTYFQGVENYSEPEEP